MQILKIRNNYNAGQKINGPLAWKFEIFFVFHTISDTFSFGGPLIKGVPLYLECIKTHFYINSSYSKLLEHILSGALFLQFGISGLVLCTCAFQLSVVFLLTIHSFMSFRNTYFTNNIVFLTVNRPAHRTLQNLYLL